MTQPPNVIDLLEQMHSAILRADFAALSALTPALEDGFSSLAQMQNPAHLTQIRAKSARNEACLLAAGRGLRAAQRRVAEIHSASVGFSTYDGRGRRAHHGAPNNLALRF